MSQDKKLSDIFDASSQDLKIGKLYKGQGFYVGYGCFEGYENGKALGQEFNLFAARGGILKSRKDFDKTLQQVASIKGLHGHDGAEFKSEQESVEAIKQGKWALPTRSMMLSHMFVRDNEVVMPQGSLADHHNRGHFLLKKLFNLTHSSYTYWTCTRNRKGRNDVSDLVYNLDAKDGGSWVAKDCARFSTLVVRGVPRAPKA